MLFGFGESTSTGKGLIPTCGEEKVELLPNLNGYPPPRIVHHLAALHIVEQLGRIEGRARRLS